MNQNFDAQELEKFAALSAQWWDPAGELKTLHQINPLRLSYLSEIMPLDNKKIIDIGCGGGILCEGMAKLGAKVTGIDLNQAGIEIAKLHQLESGTEVEYLAVSAESIAAERSGQYDMVTCLEMLEHVPDPAAIVRACATLLKPGGHVVFSTLNRNPKSYLFAIIGAEYLLRILPRNTHDYAKFIRPSELTDWARAAELEPAELKGIWYNPLTQRFKLINDVSVNYLMHAVKK